MFVLKNFHYTALKKLNDDLFLNVFFHMDQFQTAGIEHSFQSSTHLSS